MKKILKTTLVLFLSTFLFQSCSSSDDKNSANNQVSIDGESYSVPSGSVIELKMDNMTYDSQLFDRSSIVITGIKGSRIATVSFDLFYFDGLPIEGTYTINNVLDDDYEFYQDFFSNQKLCAGWTSACNVTQADDTFLINANNPVGTVTVTNNGNNNYTIQYNGNYKVYDDDFNEIDAVPVVLDITTNVIVQSN